MKRPCIAAGGLAFWSLVAGGFLFSSLTAYGYEGQRDHSILLNGAWEFALGEVALLLFGCSKINDKKRLDSPSAGGSDGLRTLCGSVIGGSRIGG